MGIFPFYRSCLIITVLPWSKLILYSYFVAEKGTLVEDIEGVAIVALALQMLHMLMLFNTSLPAIGSNMLHGT